MRTFSLILALILTTGCPGSELPTFGTFTPNELDTADTGDTAAGDEPFIIEGQSWFYDGVIPGEEEAGVMCPEDGSTCERCFFAKDKKMTISYRPEGAQNWTTVDYGTYDVPTWSESTLVVNIIWAWYPTEADTYPSQWSGYVVIDHYGSADTETIKIWPCPE